jgi:DNA-binding transcriptional LysR family regulator
MDLNHIGIFVRVVEAEGFTDAAHSVGLSKSSISRMVSQLEEELGMRLLQRTTRQLRLTDAGQAFYARARTAVAELQEATTEVVALGEEPRGVVRMTAPLDLGLLALGDFLAAFAAKYPLIHIELELTSRVVDLVGEGYDLALRAGTLHDSALIARKIGSTGLGLFASTGYLSANGHPRTLKDLAKHRCVLFRPRKGKATWQLTGPKGAESIEVTGPVGSNDLLFNRRAIELGLGIGTLPLVLAEKCPTSAPFVRVLPEYAVAGGALYLVMPSARHVPSRVAAVRDFLSERFAALECTTSNRSRKGNSTLRLRGSERKQQSR